MRQRRFGAGLAVLVVSIGFALAAATAPAGWQAVRAEDAATPVAVEPLDIPVAPAEPTVPPAPDPSPTPIVDGMPTVTAEPEPTTPAVEDASVAATDEAPELSLRVETPDVSFGRVSADGELDMAVPDVVSYPDEEGSYYVKTDAVRVTVSGDGPWTGVCSATEQGGSASGISVGGGDLAWRLASTEQWTPFAVDGPSICFTGDGGEAESYHFDLRLRVEATDGVGTFNTVVTFQVLP